MSVKVPVSKWWSARREITTYREEEWVWGTWVMGVSSEDRGNMYLLRVLWQLLSRLCI